MQRYIYRYRALTCIFIFLIMMCNYSLFPKAVEEEEVSSYYESIEFVSGDESEEEEIIHLLLAELSYDYLDGYEGKEVSEYINDHTEDHNLEIWEYSGITYKALYNSIVGDWKIYQVFNFNRRSGFYGVVFVKDNHAIFALRGSDMFTEEFPLDESNDWIATDFKFAIMNKLSRQFDDFDRCYHKLIRSFRRGGETEITLTGHSLGGALVSYGSLVTGKRGYSFDGACGHVVDLVYFEQYLKVDFSGVGSEEDMKFVNYTDDTGYMVADLIQHTNTDYLYQIDRVTYLDNLCENSLLPKVASAGAHLIWSTLSYEGNKVFFTDKVLNEGEEYTYEPEGPLYIDIHKNVLQAGIEEFNIYEPWNYFDDLDWGYMWDAFMGNIIDGRVVLASGEGDKLYASKKASDNKYSVNTVLYGGKGDDYLIGGRGDDVLISGQGGLDVLEGGYGEDTYVIDYNPGQLVTISEVGEEKVILIFRNPSASFLKGHNFKDDGTIEMGEGQSVTLVAEQEYENILIYTYCDNKMKYLGSYSELIYH